MTKKFSSKEIYTFFILFIGYIGYYLVRKNITVAQAKMIKLSILTLKEVGYISSIGVTCYAIGKFTNGFITDLIGGKRIFLIGIFGAISATIAFSLSSSFLAFAIAWGINSYFLSMGWSGLIKVCSYWFSGDNRGTILGWMSLNYQMGSSISKAFAGFLLSFPILIWQGLFYVPAIILGIMAIVVIFTLKEKPEEDVESEEDKKDSSETYGAHWTTLLLSPSFLLILWGSAVLTFVRTFFDDFSPLWLNSNGIELEKAALISSLFSLGGMIGTVSAGYISDKFFKGNRAPVMIIPGFFLGVLLLFSNFFPKDSVLMASIFFTLSGVLLFAIYSVLGGVAALDFGGNVAPSSTAGIIDGAGYLAGALVGFIVSGMKNIQGAEKLVFYCAIACIILSVSLIPLWFSYPGARKD